jgi:melibiose permease/lactose/raffinose/galactose permease
MGGAVSSGVVSAVIIVSGIKAARTAADVSAGGLLLMKVAMLIFPLFCIVGSYFIYRAKYKIDSKFYSRILSDLQEREGTATVKPKGG